MKRFFISLLSAALLGSCAIQDSDVVDDPGRTQTVLETKLTAFESASRDVQNAWLDALAEASADFTIDLSQQPAAAGGLDAFDDALDRAWAAGQRRMVVAHDVVRAAKPIEGDDNTLSHGAIGTQQQPLLGALFVAGLVYGGYSFLRSVGNAMDERANPTRAQIQSATPNELAKIREVLKLGASASASDALEAFNELPVGQRNVARGRIEDELDALEDPDFSEAAARRQATANAAVELGRAGVKTTVDMLATAAGGQGIPEVLKRTKVADATGAIIDLGLAVVGMQPLDLVDRHVRVTAVTQERESITVMDPGDELTIDAARARLESGGDDSLEAAAEVALDTVGLELGGFTGEGAIVHGPFVHIETVAMNGRTHANLELFGAGLVDALLTGDFFEPFATTFDSSGSPEIIIEVDGGSGGASGSGGAGGSGGSGGSGGTGGSGGGITDGYLLVNVTNYGAAEGYWAVRRESTLTPPPVLSSLPCGGTQPTPWEYVVEAGPFATAEEAAGALCPRVYGFYLYPLAPAECVSVFIDASGWPDHAGGFDPIIQSVCEPLL